MNRFITRISLGITIYLSSSLLHNSSGLAVSLKFSDRYELTNLEEKLVLDDGFSTISPVPNPTSSVELNLQQQSQDLSGFAELNLQQQSQNPVDFADFDSSQLLISYVSPEAFSTSVLNIQIQENDTEEDINLLSYLTNAIGNLQFDSIRNNSFVNPNVIILPQVAYENIYRGLYDFNISLVTPRAPRILNNSIAENSLISQESISNFNSFNSAFTNPSSLRNNYLQPSNTSNNSTLYSDSPSTDSATDLAVGLFPNSYNATSVGTNSSVGVYEDVSIGLESVLSENTTVYNNVQSISVSSESQYVTASKKFNGQKDRRLRELEMERERQERTRRNKREALERQMQQEQKQRERQRQQLERNTRKRREKDLKKQIQLQKQALKRQR